VAIELRLLFEALELSGVVRHIVKGVTPTSYLSILNSIKLVSTDVLEGTLVRLSQFSSVLLACYSYLGESLVNLASPLGFAATLASLIPRGRNVSNIGELGY
jgi:hypothetical protein